MPVDSGAWRPAMTTRDQLRHDIAKVLGLPAAEVPDRENLMHLGLDSLTLMKLVNKLRCQGIPVAFADMAAEPTIESWWTRLSRLQSIAA